MRYITYLNLGIKIFFTLCIFVFIRDITGADGWADQPQNAGVPVVAAAAVRRPGECAAAADPRSRCGFRADGVDRRLGVGAGGGAGAGLVRAQPAAARALGRRGRRADDRAGAVSRGRRPPDHLTSRRAMGGRHTRGGVTTRAGR